jgi:hypothetical protein
MGESGASSGSGSVVANIFLHHGLAEWFEREVRPWMKGRWFCHRLRAGNRCAEDHDRAAEAVCPLWSDHSSDEDGVDGVQETERPPGVGQWERHSRLSRIDP